MTQFPCPPPPKPPHASKHCRNYSYELGLRGRGPLCAAGVDLSGPGAARPCMPSPAGDPCPQRSEFTDAERAAWRAAVDRRLERMAVALSSIPSIGAVGHVRCAACGEGEIRWSRAPNGHLHASCSTPDCFSVMQ